MGSNPMAGGNAFGGGNAAFGGASNAFGGPGGSSMQGQGQGGAAGFQPMMMGGVPGAAANNATSGNMNMFPGGGAAGFGNPMMM